MSAIANNLYAMNAQRHYKMNTKKRAKSSEKLSSGFRINKAADDAAGLQISEKMRYQIRGLNRGTDNIQDGISLIQVADGALSEVHDLLHRMIELSIQSANGTNTPADRQAIQNELSKLTMEITRIGTDTTFNTIPVFDSMNGKDDLGSITQLVSCNTDDTGFLTDAIQINNYWLPSSTIDFQNIDESNIDRLNDGGFSFYCSRGCNEIFDFTFKTDGTPSSASNLSGKVHHRYTIDISNCQNGSDIVNEIYSYVEMHPPVNNGMDIEASNVGSAVNAVPGALMVSHSNNMIKTGSGTGLTIYANAIIESYNHYSPTGYSTFEEAKAAYPTKKDPANAGIAGKIDCSRLTAITDESDVNEYYIQCSSNSGDSQLIQIRKMNANLLGVEGLDVSTEPLANSAIDKITNAVDQISEQRSSLGAYQNRLEYSYANNQNMEENVQSAESLIRDSDMASEIVNYSKQQILEQLGTSIMAQANQKPQGIITLLQ